MTKSYDAVVVGSGPNGLAAAVELARNGMYVCVLEARATIGGGTRTEEVTLPGFHHDLCSAIHPMAVLSPFFRSLPLEECGVEWVLPEVALAHPFESGPTAFLHRSIEETAATLGPDSTAYAALMRPLVETADRLFPGILRPIRVPRAPLTMARFGMRAVRSCEGVATGRFRGNAARGLLAGACAHSVLPLDRAGSASFGLALLLAAHTHGWPCVRGGSARIAEALAEILVALDGEIHTLRPVRSFRDVPPARAVLFDLAPRQIAAIAHDQLPGRYRRRLERFRHGPGSFKIDWALSEPIPWSDPQIRRAGTVHLGGPLEEIAAAENETWQGRHPARPFVLVSQQSLFDETRAPPGRHTGWGYCHVPSGSTRDMTAEVEARVERFAPGFRDTILARSVMTAADLERHNENLIGGDIGGGANTLRQFLARPMARLDPYATPNPRLYICSSSTPPGGGVHGMCGYWAARSLIRRGLPKRSRR